MSASSLISLLLDEKRRLKAMGCVGMEVAPSHSEIQALAAKMFETEDLLECGSKLLDAGELGLSRKLFERAALKPQFDKWTVQATQFMADCDIRRARSLDDATRYPRTALRLFESLRLVQRTLSKLFESSKQSAPHRDEDIAWVVLNCVGLVFCVAEPLANYGGNLARHAADFLFWSARVLDSVVSLSTVKYLRLRCRLYALAFKACDAAGRPKAVDVVLQRMKHSVASLKNAEEMQLPVPVATINELAAAEIDCKILEFRAKATRQLFQDDDIDDEATTVPESVQTRLSHLFQEVGIDLDSKLRTKALFEALGLETRGLVAALEADDESARKSLQRDADKDWFGRERLLAVACADALLRETTTTTMSSGEENHALLSLDVPQMVRLARHLFVLRQSALFRRVQAETRRVIETLEKRSGDPCRLHTVHGIPTVSLTQELDLLRALDDFLRWDVHEARCVAVVAAAAADDGEAALKKAKKAHYVAKKDAKKRADQRRQQSAARAVAPLPEEDEAAHEQASLPPSDERVDDGGGGIADVPSLEKSLRDLKMKFTELTEAATKAKEDATFVPGNYRPIPARLTRRVIEVLEASTMGSIGEHMLDLRSDILTDAALFVWRSICKPIQAVIDERECLPDEKCCQEFAFAADFAAIQELFIEAASSVHAVLSRLDTDDALLRARVSLALAHALRERGIFRDAMQIIVAAKRAVADGRARAVCNEIHFPIEEHDHVQLARQSVTTDVDEESVKAAELHSRLGAHGYGGSGIFGAGSVLDPLHQALAAVDLDLLAANAQLELELDKRKGATEHRLLGELRKHCAAKAIVKTIIAVHHGETMSADERNKYLTEALKLLRNAEERELRLLKHIAPWTDCSPGKTENVIVSQVPPPPALLSRTHTTITVQPRAWKPTFDRRKDHMKSATPHHLRLFGKATGAGTDVSLTNVDLRGLGCQIDYDGESGKASSITVSELCPYETYVFALAAYDDRGTCISSIGDTCEPIEALHPLPMSLSYSFVAHRAHQLGVTTVAATAARIVYLRFVDTDDAKGHVLKRDIVRRSSLAEIFEFVKCAGLLATLLENSGLPVAYMPGLLEKVNETGTRRKHSGALSSSIIAADGADFDNTVSLHGPAQVARLTKAQILRCAVEVSTIVARQDPELVFDAVWRCYHACAPLIKLRCAQRSAIYLFPLISTMHQALWVSQPKDWDLGAKHLLACLSYQVGKTGRAVAELGGAGVALLANLDASGTASTLNASELTGDPKPNLDSVKWPVGAMPEQKALVEAFQSTTAIKADFLEGVAAIPLLRDTGAKTIEKDSVLATWNALIKPHALGNTLNDGEDNKPEVPHVHGISLLRMACRVLRNALNTPQSGEVMSLLSKTQLASYESFGAATRRILEDEIIRYVSSQAELAMSMYYGHLVKSTSESTVHSDESDLNRTAKKSATVAAGSKLPYIAFSSETTTSDEGEEPHRTEMGESEYEELLWLSELEILQGLAIVDSFMPDAVDQLRRDRTDSSKAFVFVSKAGTRQEFKASGPVTNIEDALSCGLFDITKTEILEKDLDVDRRLEDECDYTDADSRVDAAANIARSALAASSIELDVEKNSTSERSTATKVEKWISTAIWHLSRAACFAKSGRHWHQMWCATSHLWNIVIANWISPFSFSSLVLEGNDHEQFDPMPFVCAANAMLEFFEQLNSGLVEPLTTNAMRAPQPCTGITNETSLKEGKQGTSPKTENPVAYGEHTDNNEQQSLRAGSAVDDEDDDIQSKRNSLGVPKGVVDEVLSELNASRGWTCEFIVFSLKTLACDNRWDVLVHLARRLTNNVLLSQSGQQPGQTGVFMREAHVLAAKAQEQILLRATARCRLAERALGLCEQRLAQATERRIANRRGRQSRLRGDVDRSDLEVKLEERKRELSSWAARLRASQQVAEHYCVVLKKEEADFSRGRPVAADALDSCRRALKQIQSPREVTSRVASSYKRAERLIRRAREPLLLAQALQDRGDLHFCSEGLAEGKATKCWQEAIDALFSTIDSHLTWRRILASYGRKRIKVSALGKSKEFQVNGTDANKFPELFTLLKMPDEDMDVATPAATAGLAKSLTLIGCMVAGTLLGKLALVSHRNDLDARSERARFAKFVFCAIFASSIPHPGVTACTVDTSSRQPRGVDVSYALYAPMQLSPRLIPFFEDSRKCCITATCAALRCCVLSLLENGRAVQALPLCCLLEFIAAKQCLDVAATARAKILRLQVLARLGLVAHAASILASLLTGSGGFPTIDGSYVGLKPVVVGSNCDEASEETTSLPFYGLPPFNAGLPLEANAAAISWIAGEVRTPQYAEEGENCTFYSTLSRGCSGCSRKIVNCYGLKATTELAIARAELVACLAGTSSWQGESSTMLRRDADSLAFELQQAVLVAAWESYETSTANNVGMDSDRFVSTKPSSEDLLKKVLPPSIVAPARFRLTYVDALTVAQCAELRARLAVDMGRFSYARQHAAVAMALLEGPAISFDSSYPHSVSLQESNAGLWFSCRRILAECSMCTGRPAEALVQCEAGLKEAASVRCGVALRRLEAVACRSSSTTERAEKTLTRAHALLAMYRDSDDKGLDFAECLMMTAFLRRSAATESVDALIAARNVAAAAALLDAAEDVLLKQAHELNWSDESHQMSRSVDEVDKNVTAPLTNLYLPPVVALVRARCGIAENLMDAAAASDLGHYINCASYGQTGHEMRKAALAKAEEAIFTMRTVAETPCYVRAATLVVLGRARRVVAAYSGDERLRTSAEDPLLEAILCSASSDHDTCLMRDAAMELVHIHTSYQFWDTSRHLQQATHFLDMAATLANMQSEVERIGRRPSDKVLPSVVTEALEAIEDIHEGPEKGLELTSASSVMQHVASLRRQARNVFFEEDDRPRRMLMKIHAALSQHYPDYWDRCCLRPIEGSIEIPVDHTPTVSKGLVCVQWTTSFVAPANTPSPPKSDEGLFPMVEAYILLGVTDDQRFSHAPHLLKVRASKAVEIDTMRDRIAALGCALEREMKRSSQGKEDKFILPDLFYKRFRALLRDIHAFFKPDTPSSLVHHEPDTDTVGDPFALVCELETLRLLQAFFDQDHGCHAQHQRLCFFLRDIWSDEPTLIT